MQANILELTGRRPRLEAGRQLRRVALSLPRVGDAGGAAEWLVSYNRWEQDFASFLDEKSEYADGSVCISSSRCFVLGLVPFCWTRR